MYQTTTSSNTDGNLSIALNTQPVHLSFKLNPTDSWTNLLQKFNIQGSRSISVTQLITSNDYQLALRCEDGLRIFQFSSQQNIWKEMLYSEDFCDNNGFDQACYPVQFWKIPSLNKEILICRVQHGFYFADYNTSQQKLDRLAQDTLFPDSSRWYDECNQLQWGSFYGSNMPLGLFTRHIEQGIRFYILNPNGFQDKQRPIWKDEQTNKSISLLLPPTVNDDHFEFADVRSNGTTNIIHQNDAGLCIYGLEETDNGFVFKEIIKTNLCNKDSGWRSKRDKFWFVRLTKSEYCNLVLLQSDGLKVYQYDEKLQNFHCINHETSMSEQNGWNKQHLDSLLFADLNSNSFMQLIYCGPHGLTICCFNLHTNRWENNLKPEELNLEYRYAVPVMFVPARRSPTKTSILITKHHDKFNCFTIENQLIQSTAITNSNRILSSNSISHEQEKKMLKSRLIPSCGEIRIPTKSIALLRETLDIKPLLSAVNTNSGKLGFTLSLLDINTGLNGLQMKLALRYEGINQHASILGIGWNLLEDYIAVDYQGNVDRMAHRYYWITNHGTIPLIRQNVHRFRLATSYNLYLIKSLNENNLPDIQDNAVVLLGPKENNDYDAYCVQNNRWLRNNENNHLKKVLIKNPSIEDFHPIESNGYVQITEKNLKQIVNMIKIVTSNENYFDMNIIYDDKKQYWQLTTSDGEKRFYGNISSQTNSIDAIPWTIGWNHWLGIGSDETNEKQYPVRWHLKEIQGHQNEKITYHYENIRCKIGNQSFTQSLYLKSISNNYNINVELVYEEKSSEEYKKPPLKDADGNFQLSPTFYRYLKTMKIITRTHIQTIKFQYKLQNQRRLLVTLSQLEDPFKEPVLKFSYKDFGELTQIDEICLPNGEKLNFTYQLNKLQHLECNFDFCTGEHPVQKQPQVTAGSNYVILSEINGQSLNWKIMQKNQASIMKFIQIDDVLIYRAFTRHDYFGFIVKKQNNIFVLLLYHRHSSGTWSLESQQYEISSFKIQCIDDILIVVNPKQQIICISWNNEQQRWQDKILARPSNVSQGSQIYFATNQSLIIAYDDQHLWIHFKDFNQNWQAKFLKKIPNFFSKSKQTLEKFDISSTLFENLHDYLKQYLLQSSNNIICLFSWQEENEKLQSMINIFMLDENKNIALEELHQCSEECCEEIFSDYEEQEFIPGDKIKYRLKYQKLNGKFRVIFEPQQVTKDIEEQKSAYRRHYELKDQDIIVTIQGIKQCVLYNTDTGKLFSEKIDNLKNDSHSLSEQFKEIFLIDLNKHLPQLNLNEIICGENKLVFNGDQWKEKSVDENIRERNKSIALLGKDYVLRKENQEDSFKLFQQNGKGESIGKYLFDFGVISLENISNGYPTYIAYKQKDHRIFILPFDEKKKLGSAYHLTNGDLTAWSNAQFLVVSQSNSQEKLIIYSNLGCRKPYEDPVIIKSNLTIRNEHRPTGYFYDEQSATLANEIVVYHKTGIVPGNEKSRHGWIEINSESENGQKKFFNSKGEEICVPVEKSKENATESEPLPDPKSTLFLPNTSLEIAKFHNVNIEDDEAAYLGFESYEIDYSSQWNYSRDNIIKNVWSLTGECCLRLKNQNESLYRSFHPKNQNCSYQAACWLRSNKRNSPSVDDFRAIIKTNKNDQIGILSSSFLISRDDWFYFEITIDLPHIKSNGALTPIYSVKINNQLRLFQEETIRIENPHYFPFNALDISKNTAIEQLRANIHNEEIRSLISSDIKMAFLQDTLPGLMKIKPNYENIRQKFEQHQQKIQQCVEKLNENISLKDNQPLDFSNLLESIKKHPNHQELKIISDQIELELNNYTKADETLKDFIEHFFDQPITISTFDALAKLNKICFYIWKTNLTNELTLFRTNEDKEIKFERTIHLLSKGKVTELQKLIDVSGKCLSKEKRQSLEQGHDNIQIDLIIQPTGDYSLDIDHLRFSPPDQHFYARVYHPLTYQVNALLDGNGSIKYVFYNQQYEPLAVTDWKKYLTELNIHGRQGSALAFGSTLARQQPQSQMKIKPLHGFYEDFSQISFEQRWLINTIDVWKRIPGCLYHATKSCDSLILENEWIDKSSAGLQVKFDLQSNSKIELKLHQHQILIECSNKNQTNLIVNGENLNSIPLCAEYLIIAEENRLWLWINGQLQIDKGFQIQSKNSNYLSFNLTGNLSLSQLFVFSKPTIDVSYKNILDEELQTIQLENSCSAIVTQILYDHLGRKTIVTKPTRIIVDDNNKALLAFQNDFIQNQYIQDKTGKLIGTVNKLNPKDEGYCYYEIRYDDNPLNEKTMTGQPGRLFQVNEIGCLKYTRDAQSSFIDLLFPNKDGYSMEVCTQSHGTKQITVFDSYKNQIAVLVQTTIGYSLLTTYEYDDQNRVVKVLPPTFHAHQSINTFNEVTSYKELMTKWQVDKQQRNLEKNFSTRLTYNKHNQVIKRTAPDTNKQILIYSREKLLRFILQYDIHDKPCRVVYNQYDRWGDLCAQGYSTGCFSHEDLQNFANNYSELPQATLYLQTIKNDNSTNRNLRNKTITSVIHQSHGIWRESSSYLPEETLSYKEIIIINDKSWEIYRTDFTYSGEQISSMTYPMLFEGQPLTIVYSRNKQGSITAIGTPNNLEQWAKFTYTAQGHVSDEIHLSNKFTTHYDYNSPGYLETIENSYLKETISYMEGSYGQAAYFDGTIAKTQFKAQWFNRCDSRFLSLNAENLQQRLNIMGHQIMVEKAEYYLKMLQNAGFLDKNRRVIKEFLPREAALYLSRDCGGTIAYALSEVLNEYFTQDYGHQYCYGHHMELTKAKYIIGDKMLKPIQPLSFYEKFNEIDSEKSISIWKILVNEIYIWPDNDNGIHLQGKVNTDKWIDYETLRKNLGEYSDYDHLLTMILQKYVARREVLTLENFQKIFLTWLTVSLNTQQRTIDIYLETAKKIWTILSNKGYLYSINNLCTLFTKHFYEILKDYQIFIPQIVNVLQEHSVCQMGESACDVEAYMIDENGNHRHYWTGYSRYVLHYKENNNQILNIDYKSMSRDKPATNFKMTHDAFGNVTKAEHKGITEIVYHPVSNRPSIIKLQDGRQVLFDYDVRGERVRKYVMDSNGEKVKEVLYLRDNEGRSLAEKVNYFTEIGHYEQQTMYIYGPKGLIGFIRNDEFYSVICDHEGSIRLIIKNEEVVAAYDYLPYGNLIRQYGIPQVQISYRYTGQEWDEETGLYNYHARLYDPDIGRFYQIDPQEQYASPYKYAGNSPVSMVDPDGEFAFILLTIALAVGGGYLGGAAANNSWDPREWDLSKPRTYLGIAGGALTGALMPVGFTISVGALASLGFSVTTSVIATSTLGIAGMYLQMASANQTWDPSQWQWSRPMIWSSGFQGFSLGASIPGGICNWYQYYTNLGIAGKWAFAMSSGALSIGMGYLSVASANNSWSPGKWKLTPATVFAGLGGAFGGFMAPLGVLYTGKSIMYLQTTSSRILMGCGTLISGGACSFLFVSAANDSFTNWNMSSPKTYESIVGGFFFGISLPGLPKALSDGMKKTSEAWKRHEYYQKEHYKIDQQFANDIHEAVNSYFDNSQGITKPSKGGVICIMTVEDGKKFFSYSGSDKNATVYGTINHDGTVTGRIENIAPNPSLRDGRSFTFDIVGDKLNITREDVWRQSGMPNERGHNLPRAPEICAEPRTMDLAFEAGYMKHDFASFSAFRRNATGVVPVNACPNCQVYVPGKIYTEVIFGKAFQNPFNYMIYTAPISIQQLQKNIGKDANKKKN